MNDACHTGRKLSQLISSAIRDGKVTDEEYGEIVALANADRVVDSQERRLLNQLEDMIQSKAVVKVSDD